MRHPLRYLFLDMNAFFAAVEQQDRPELRERPIAVVPVLTETTCCIAASYEAKRYGIKTGTPVAEARLLCPPLIVVEARPRQYVMMHRQLVEAVERCTPVESILSIDELRCRLVGAQMRECQARQLAERIKRTIARELGPWMRCSVGLAPSAWMAKVAAELRKPDGLTVLDPHQLCEHWGHLPAGELPGIGARMQRRLEQRGICSIAQLYRLSVDEWERLWHSRLLAEQWYRRLRGIDVSEPPPRRSTLGHSHVLPPQLRDEVQAWMVAVALLQKAATRLRQLGYCTAGMVLTLDYPGRLCWQHRCRFPTCYDTLTLLQQLKVLWQQRPPGKLHKISVVLTHLQSRHNTTPSLFHEDLRLGQLSHTLDHIQQRFGHQAICFGSMFTATWELPTRIAFSTIPEV
ncbi:MAG: DNA polymerase IV [Planctomycetaceae bacterium]|nr:MAG: DNA polymerase IV [Planctomycetaceae bacterium]